MVIASEAAAVQGVRAAVELPGLAPFEIDDARAAARRRRAPRAGTGAEGYIHSQLTLCAVLHEQAPPSNNVVCACCS